jgi:hypothetical protein
LEKFEVVEAIRLDIAAAEKGRVKPARRGVGRTPGKLGISD